MSADKTKMSLSVKNRPTSGIEVDTAAVEAFAAQAETERQRKPAPKAPPSHAVVRQLFSMPDGDAEIIEEIAQRLMRQGVGLNKSEIVRAALHGLSGLEDADLVRLAGTVERSKPGRRG